MNKKKLYFYGCLVFALGQLILFSLRILDIFHIEIPSSLEWVATIFACIFTIIGIPLLLNLGKFIRNETKNSNTKK